MSAPDNNQKSQFRQRWLLVILVLLTVALSSITSVDQVAAHDYENLFQRAIITFALARTLNGVISAVQGTELALQPAGVGVTLTPGQILDPVNDLVERFSWIMLGATLSLGIQQVLLEVGQWWLLRVVVAVLGLSWLWLRVSRQMNGVAEKRRTEQILLRVFIITLFIRFAVPLALIANEALFDLFLEPRYTESSQVIEAAGAEIEEVNARPIVEEDEEDAGLMDTLERALSNTRESLDIGRRVDQIKESAADLVEHLLQLCVVFILQTGILPIAFLWAFLQLFKSLLRLEGVV
jgi:hypothetical protein